MAYATKLQVFLQKNLGTHLTRDQYRQLFGVPDQKNDNLPGTEGRNCILPGEQTSIPLSQTEYCGFPRRLLVMLYDSVILLGLLIFASAVALPFGDFNKFAFKDFWFTAWLLLVIFAYFAICWKYGGMTVGMRAWKVHLIDKNHAPISWWQCFLRFLVSLASLSVFGLGFIWALWDEQNRTWHDLAAETLLIKNG